MGIWNSLTKSGQAGATAKYDDHSISSSEVLKGGAGGILPTTSINWEVDTPELIDKPATATLEAAEQEELEAAEHKNAVDNGLRVLKARAQKAQQNLKLVAGHRNYMGKVAKVSVGIAGANKALADKLQDCRAAFAGMGHSLDRKVQSIDHKVEMIKEKYQQRGR